ncbi:MAG: hypothetical protein M3440_04650 [Chloroflexota bacterium]|nr:hypothetical protein [Chloroflexota bacterium]
MAGDTSQGYNRVESILEKWENHRVPEDGEPDEVMTSFYWADPDGNEVTDDAVIEMLTARYEQNQERV